MAFSAIAIPLIAANMIAKPAAIRATHFEDFIGNLLKQEPNVTHRYSENSPEARETI
jgi:hypothetical protein